ncbi:MAG: DNA polymerase III subunit gamma/tau [Phycisphaerae bacterium]|nr:DNA polymerase III subunit gamma/tau [Phycisphaerae bacterium]
MAYTVLARRYRSQTFDDVVGQDAVAQTLRNAIESDRVAHAYLFNGTRGVGKTTMARVLAKSLNCLEFDAPTVTPCCKCDSCVNVNTGEDLDVIEIDGASNNGVDNIRELRQNAIYRPARSRFKIYIIDEVHMLSTGAFNALLKILEEPPEHVKFIFATTEPNKVLPTIQSRCQRFDFSSISPPIVGKQLKKVLETEKIKADDDLILHLSRLANGSMRDALSLLDQLISTGTEPLTVELLEEFLGEPNRAKICHLLDRIAEKDAAEVLNIVDSLLKSGLTCIQIVDSLIDCMRDLMVIAAAGDNSELLLLTPDEKKAMSQVAKKFDAPALIFSITTMEKLRWTIKNSESARALLEASMLRLALSEHFLGVEKLINQLKQSIARPAASPAGQVKKKLTADRQANDQRSAAIPINEIPTAAPMIPAGELTLESIQQNWENIASGAKGMTASMLKNGVPAQYNGGTLTVQFKQEFNRVGCQDRHDEICKIFKAATGASINMKFELQTGGDSANAPSSPAAAAPAQAGNKPMSSTKRQEVMDDPDVKAIMSGLNATLLNIELAKEEL